MEYPNFALYEPQKKNEQKYTVLQPAVTAFIYANCIVGDPHGAMTLDLMRTAFIGWLFEYMGPVYRPHTMKLTESDITIGKFTQLLKKTFLYPAFNNAIKGDTPLAYKGISPFITRCLPEVKTVTSARVPVVLGLMLKDPGEIQDTYLREEIDRIYPEVNETKIGTFRRDGSAQHVEPFRMKHWNAGFQMYGGVPYEDAITEDTRHRLAKRRMMAWNDRMILIKPELVIPDYKP